MDAFCLRLLSFYDKGVEGNPGKWPLVTPTAEDMAGAGFKLHPSGNQLDNVNCESCGLECFKWEANDNPYEDHRVNSPHCPFVKEEIFTQFREAYELKVTQIAINTPPISPGQNDDVSAAPKTPTKKPRRGKNAMSPIRTVADLEPQSSQAAPATPLRIQIQGSGVSMAIQVNSNDVVQTPTKKRRME